MTIGSKFEGLEIYLKVPFLERKKYNKMIKRKNQDVFG